MVLELAEEVINARRVTATIHSRATTTTFNNTATTRTDQNKFKIPSHLGQVSTVIDFTEKPPCQHTYKIVAPLIFTNVKVQHQSAFHKRLPHTNTKFVASTNTHTGDYMDIDDTKR